MDHDHARWVVAKCLFVEPGNGAGAGDIARGELREEAVDCLGPPSPAGVDIVEVGDTSVDAERGAGRESIPAGLGEMHVDDVRTSPRDRSSNLPPLRWD